MAAIDTVNMTVTLNLVNGFSFGRPVWYISMDASIPLAAAIEHNTYAPLMASLLLGHDDSAFSPIRRIFIATNGPEARKLQQPSAPGSFCGLSGWIQAEQHTRRYSHDRTGLQPGVGCQPLRVDSGRYQPGIPGSTSRGVSDIDLRPGWIVDRPWRSSVRQRWLLHQLPNRPKIELINRTVPCGVVQTRHRWV